MITLKQQLAEQTEREAKLQKDAETSAAVMKSFKTEVEKLTNQRDDFKYEVERRKKSKDDKLKAYEKLRAQVAVANK